MPWSLAVPAAAAIGGGLIANNASQHAAANISNVPQNWRTALGSSAVGGTTTIDPSVRALQNRLLGQYQQLYPQAGQFAGQAAGMYGNLLGQAGANQGGFVQSVVDPVQQMVNQSYGSLIQDQQNRGIRGSSLASDALANFDYTAGRALSDATASGLQQSLGLQSQLVGNQLQAGLAGINAQSGLLGAQNTINQQNLAQELQSLGLDANQTQALLGQMISANQARAGGQAGIGSGIMGLASAVGDFFG